MDEKSKLLFTVLIFALCLSAGATFYKYVIMEQYAVFLNPDEVPSYWDALSL